MGAGVIGMHINNSSQIRDNRGYFWICVGHVLLQKWDMLVLI